MGLIAAVKVGYKSKMLELLLDIFDIPGGFVEAARVRSQQRPGCKGIDYGGKAHVLDAMKILDRMWSQDSKYATNDSIQRCWRKAAILPVSWDIEINTEVGNASMAMKDKTISKAECEYLCGLMSALSTNVKETGLDTQNLGYGLSNLIVELGEFPDGADLKEMMIEWIDVEDNEEVIDDDVMEALEELERVVEAVDSEEEDPMGGNSNDEEEEDEEPLISSIQATSYLHELRRYGRSVGLTADVDIVLLDGYERRLASARQTKVTERAFQPTLTTFFSRARNNSGEDVEDSEYRSMIGNN
jgi:hypothetical protein